MKDLICFLTNLKSFFFWLQDLKSFWSMCLCRIFNFFFLEISLVLRNSIETPSY